jgi:CheY-like chemotaxis protein
MLTTSSALIDKEKCKVNKVNAFFTKPIEPDSFKTALVNHKIPAFSSSI